jgi:hypothetical protein
LALVILLLVLVTLIVVLSARAVLRRAPAGERIDPFALGEPWRLYVRDALQAEVRFRDVVAAVRPGPLKERLDDIGGRIHEGVEECWRVAKQANAMQKAVNAVDVRAKERDLSRIQGELTVGGDETLERVAESLRAQLASGARMEAAVWDARDRLRVLDARLAEAVTRASELSLRSPAEAELGVLGHDVDDLVGEMEALRSGLEELGG